MQLTHRILALPLAAVLASGTFFASAPAQASPKSKTYKTGALALGAVGAYLLSKGNTLEGAAALGGGYLAYKKGEKERKKEKYEDRYGYGYDNRDRNRDYSKNGGYYDNSGYNNGGYSNGNYNNGGYNNGNYNNSGGGYYNGNTYYNSNADYHYNDSNRKDGNSRNNDRDCRHDNGLHRGWNR